METNTTPNSTATVFVEVKCEPTEITMTPHSHYASPADSNTADDPIVNDIEYKTEQSDSKDIAKLKNSNHVGTANYTAPTINPENDLVCNLLETPFSDWKDHCKADLFASCERPTPPLAFKLKKENKRTGKSYNIQFKKSWYRDFSWLCGSTHVNKLFCWPCLLVGTRKNVWTRTGFADFLNITRALHTHANSAEHLKCTLQLKQLENNGNTIANALNENSRLHVAQFNENVRLNRLFVRTVIDAVLFLIKRELAFESDELYGNFNELLRLLLSNSPLETQNQYAKIKDAIVEDLETISSELIQCVFEYVKDYVRNEIVEAKFFSVQVADAADLTHASQCSVVLRYVNSDADLTERFLGFYDVGDDRTVANLLETLHLTLRQFGYETKLVAQSYDGGCVRSTRLNELQSRIKDEAPQAVFLHCFEHDLIVVLEQVLKRNSRCRLFFANVDEIRRFFNLRRTRSINPIESQWSSVAESIIGIVANWDVLKTLYGEITDDDYDHKFVYLSRSLADNMNDFEFAFLSVVFDDVFHRTRALFATLRDNRTDIDACVSAIKGTCETLKANEARLADLYVEAKRKANVESIRNCDSLYCEILEQVSAEITQRFGNTDKLGFLALGDSSKFEAYTKKFPAKSLTALVECYPKLFGKTQRLKNELDLIYRDEQYRNVDVETLLKILKENDLHADVFGEAYKLFCLILTMPSMGTGVSCSRKIRTCLRNETAALKSPSLMSVTIEKELLWDLIKKQPFYDDIIDRYATLKRRGIDLIYKK